MLIRNLSAGLCLLTFAGLIQAGPIANGTFETGTLSPWTSSGTVLVQGAFPLATGPLSGSFQAWMITDAEGQSNGTLPAALETFLGLAAGTLQTNAGGGTADAGSGIRQNFDAIAGDVVGFDWNFLTAEPTIGAFPDYAFYVFGQTGSLTLTVLKRATDALTPTGGTYSESIAGHVNINVGATGNYILGFGVINVDDNSTDSNLLVDNVTQGTSAVPEPGTTAMLGAGLAALAVFGLRKRRLLSNRALGLIGMLVATSAASVGQSLIISEFRLRGPNGANDEFVEIYNASGADHTVTAATGTGYGIAASDGILRCTIPNGTVIPAAGHFLCVNSVGYSLATYAAGNGTTATGDATFTTDIPDNAGIAIFNTNIPANFTLGNRFDAVGSTSEANVIYKEGTGYNAITPFAIDYSFFRDYLPSGVPKDTGNNGTDFLYGDTNGTLTGGYQRLGAAGPENLSSPIQRNSTINCVLLEPSVGSSSNPNRVVDLTSVPSQNSTFGTITYRRACTNNTGANITRLRFRIIAINTFPVPTGTADLRAMTVSSTVVPTIAHGLVNVDGTTLEQPPSQPNGAGINASLSVGNITLGTPLANGATIYVQWKMGVQQTGREKFTVNAEALP